MDHVHGAHGSSESYIVCECGHGRDCTHGYHCPDCGHAFRPTYMVYPGQGIAYNFVRDQIQALKNGAIQPIRRNHGSDSGRPLHGQGRSSGRGNAHGHHHGPSRRATQTRRRRANTSDRPAHGPAGPYAQPPEQQPRRRRTTSGPGRDRDEEEEDLDPHWELHVRTFVGNSFAEQQPARYNAGVAAMERDRDSRRQRQQQHHHHHQQERDYELEDLRERYNSDSSSRSDPELDRNSNGSPPPRYEP
ncbi:hypothetical protein F4818DRAFT_451420 [Hypoxylon cercidicola]|nr:hypothetical protein F4818DRAFT_451420 [Hypoxylon cercidicola]